MLVDKVVILGVTSSSAIYKACDLVSRLKKLDAIVWVVMTKEAAQLVSPLIFRTLSGNPVITDLFSAELGHLPIPHISLTRQAALILLAPCTANIIGKLAHGIADDPLTTIVLAATARKLIAPAMNGAMWRNPVVIGNIEKLKKLNFEFIGPEEGKLACGDEDMGRMSEPAEIVSRVRELLGIKQDLKGKHILVTAGGTKEAIDPVRYLANRSSGKMGYALARAAQERGAQVTLISSASNLQPPAGVRLIKVESATEMLTAALDHYGAAQAVIMAAAVADFRPQKQARNKIKQAPRGGLELKLTPDILKTLARQKSRVGKVLVGFALETENLIKGAREKLKAKNLDLIVANNHSAFDSDEIEFSLINKKGKIINYSKQPKAQAAQVILDYVSAALRQ